MTNTVASTAPVISASGTSSEPHPSWMTTVLRPTGRLDRRSVRRLRPLLLALALVPGLVVIDLSAAAPVSAAGWRLLEETSVHLDAVGGGLLVNGVEPSSVPAEATAITVLADPQARAVGSGESRGPTPTSRA